ncbi:hypothetical protein ES703_74707 [subsurface metagenome]
MEAKVKAEPKAEIVKPKEVEQNEVLNAILELTVKDKDGKVTEHRVLKSESFVRQWLEILYVQASGKRWYGYPVRDTSDTVRQVQADEESMRADALATDTTYGIAVGTGDTAPDIENHALEAQIAHGTGGGQLQYSDMAIAHPAYDATLSQLTVTRDFANGSGDAVTVYEIGLILTMREVGDTTRYFLVIRDVIGAGIAVPTGQTLTVNYRIQAEV